MKTGLGEVESIESVLWVQLWHLSRSLDTGASAYVIWGWTYDSLYMSWT